MIEIDKLEFERGEGKQHYDKRRTSKKVVFKNT